MSSKSKQGKGDKQASGKQASDTKSGDKQASDTKGSGKESGGTATGGGAKSLEAMSRADLVVLAGELQGRMVALGGQVAELEASLADATGALERASQPPAGCVRIDVPYESGPVKEYPSCHLQVQLSREEGNALRRVLAGCNRTATRIGNAEGAPFVERHTHAVRHLMRLVEREAAE